MAEIKRSPNESVDEMVKRFKQQIQKDETNKEIKRREYFVSPSYLRLQAAAARREKAAAQNEKVPSGSKISKMVEVIIWFVVIIVGIVFVGFFYNLIFGLAESGFFTYLFWGGLILVGICAVVVAIYNYFKNS